MTLTEDPTLTGRFTIDEIERRRATVEAPVLTDDPSLRGVENIHYGADFSAIAAIVEASHASWAGRIVFLCFNSDALASSVVLLLEERQLRFKPGGPARPVAPYWRTNDAARDTLHELWSADGMNFGTVFEIEDYQYLMQVIDQTRHVPGDYVEIGVARASSARIALHFMRKLGIRRRCFFLDTFDGFNYPQVLESADCCWKGDGAVWGDQARATSAIEPYVNEGAGLAAHVVRANIMTDDLPVDIGPVAVANIDVDMLGAVRSAVARIHPRLVPGGVMILEDAGHTPLLYGARAAVDEFTAEHGHLYFRLYVSSGQALFIKR